MSHVNAISGILWSDDLTVRGTVRDTQLGHRDFVRNLNTGSDEEVEQLFIVDCR